MVSQTRPQALKTAFKHDSRDAWGTLKRGPALAGWCWNGEPGTASWVRALRSRRGLELALSNFTVPAWTQAGCGECELGASIHASGKICTQPNNAGAGRTRRKWRKWYNTGRPAGMRRGLIISTETRGTGTRPDRGIPGPRSLPASDACASLAAKAGVGPGCQREWPTCEPCRTS